MTKKPKHQQKVLKLYPQKYTKIGNKTEYAKTEIALELLVRSGDPDGVIKLAKKYHLDKEKLEEKNAEAAVYYVVRSMEDDSVWATADELVDYLKHPLVAKYFQSTTNTELLERMVAVLLAGTYANIEAYGQIASFEVLNVNGLEGAVKRYLHLPQMKEQMIKLTERGYQLVFSPHDIEAEMVQEFFPIIDRWRELVSPQKVVEEAIENLAEVNEELFEPDEDYDNYRAKFFYAALEKMIEMTDRESVSKLVGKYFPEDISQRLAEEGKIDAVQKKVEEKSSLVEEVIRQYEQREFIYEDTLKQLEKYLGKEGKEQLTERIGKWFREGKIWHLTTVAKFKRGKLYNKVRARKIMSEIIVEYCHDGKFDELVPVLGLPSYLIDKKNPAISGVVEAYEIYQKRKK